MSLRNRLLSGTVIPLMMVGAGAVSAASVEAANSPGYPDRIGVSSVSSQTFGGAVNPAAAKRTTSAESTVVAGYCNPCNPCAAKGGCHPCNPCAAKGGCHPCNPCAAKGGCHPCHPCNPCAAKH